VKRTTVRVNPADVPVLARALANGLADARAQGRAEGAHEAACAAVTLAEPLGAWPAFALAVRARLDAGARQYGDASFARPAPELVGELEAEALDLCGWSYVLWSRLRALRAAADAAERGQQGGAAP
jgi:hypothetical protein